MHSRARLLRRLLFVSSALTGVPLAAGWVISRAVLHPQPTVEDHTLADFALTAEPISFSSRDGTRLAGWFIAPPARASRPAAGIVLSHGWGRSRAELLPHADILHRAGYAVLAFDYRYCGESAGAAVTMGLREQDDLLGAIDALCARPEVEARRVGVFGMSLGAVIAILVTARDARVRALTVEAPFATHEVIMTRSIRHYFHLPSFPIAETAKWVIERRLGTSLNSAQPLPVAHLISPRPLFVIADERDAVVGHEETERVFAAAGEPKRFWLVPGADHARGWQAARLEYERRLVDFFGEALSATAEPVDALAGRSGGVAS